jgi:hypothetical protein
MDQGSFVIGLTRRHARLTQKELKITEETAIPHRPLPSLQSILKIWCETVGIDKECGRGHMLLTAQSGVSENQKTSFSLKSQSHVSSINAFTDGWACQSCTYRNSSRTWRCDICRADRVQFPLKSAPGRGKGKETSQDEALSSTMKRSVSEPQSQIENKRAKLRHRHSPLPHICCDVESSLSLTIPTPLTTAVTPASPPEPSVESHHLDENRSDTNDTPAPAVPALMSDEEIDQVFFKLQEPSHLYSPPVVVMVGRRVGDMRMGKNLLIGPTGNAVTVETLVMEVMKLPYEDGLLYEPLAPGTSTGEGKSKSAADTIVTTTRYQHLCGDWIGWHCEGSIVRSLFPLLLWEEIYDISIPDVFQTKYQEAPLDLHADHGLFFLNRSLLFLHLSALLACPLIFLSSILFRATQIESKLKLLELMSSEDLIGPSPPRLPSPPSPVPFPRSLPQHSLEQDIDNRTAEDVCGSPGVIL